MALIRSTYIKAISLQWKKNSMASKAWLQLKRIEILNITKLNYMPFGVVFSPKVPRNTPELKHHDNKILRAEQSNLLSEGHS